jgi:hypothetical protein
MRGAAALPVAAFQINRFRLNASRDCMKKDVSYADLYRAYVTENRTKKAVAAQFGVGQDTVAIWLRR